MSKFEGLIIRPFFDLDLHIPHPVNIGKKTQGLGGWDSLHM